MFLSDQETATDLLYYEAIARTVVKLIRDTPEAPVTIGVHGDWGAGKSSVLKMTEAGFAGDKRVVCLWFNGWTFEGFEDAKVVIIETIVEELRRARPLSDKVAEAAKKVLKRVDWLKLARKAGGFVFTAATGIPTFDQVQGLAGLAANILAKPLATITAEDIKSIIENAGDFIKDAPADEGDHLPAHIHAFREEFKALLEAAEIDQLVVIVDDLDRCLPQTAIATLEAIRLFLFVERTAFVIGADELMIEYAVREHFPDLPPSSGPVSYARNYLEKLIQVPFRIPALGLAETRIYVTLLLAEATLGANDARFKNLLAAARNELRRPWASRGLDRAAVEKAMGGTLPGEIAQAVAISAQVAKILADGARGNPRQIKRFLNSMMLRTAIAQERGFGEDIARPALAKIMLAERFYPDFYEHIARLAAGAADGKPEALGWLENHVRTGADAAGADDSKGGKAAKKSGDVSPELEEWAKNEWVKNWALIEPALAAVDLRPYVFVTRDKRGVLGGLVAASHLESLVERLMASKLSAHGAAADVGKLGAGEPEQLFDAIRERILAEDNLSSEPRGVQGLLVVVASQPALQRRLLTFARELPIRKIGTWAPSGLAGAFNDPQVKAEFGVLVQAWAEQSDNPMLKTAAQLVAKMGKN